MCNRDASSNLPFSVQQLVVQQLVVAVLFARCQLIGGHMERQRLQSAACACLLPEGKTSACSMRSVQPTTAAQSAAADPAAALQAKARLMPNGVIMHN
jgi:hypothetical protein